MKTDGKSIVLGNLPIAPEDVVAVGRGMSGVVVEDAAYETMRKGRQFLEGLLSSGNQIYGVSTGFGELQGVAISKERQKELQKNLIYSHACGQGEKLPVEIVRGMMVILANSLLKGASAARHDVVRLIVEMLNKRVHPVVPSQGSVGASGDLVPLAHIALVLTGEGIAEVDSRILPGNEALKSRGLSPLELEPKEGLSLINGTHFMSSFLSFCVYDAVRLLESGVVASAMSLEALLGTDSSLAASLHALRPHRGQATVAVKMRELIAGSEIVKSHKDCSRVQDQYTLRCIPQVLGAVLDVLRFAAETAAVEINSVTDNPVCISSENRVLSGGNFHGEPLAFALDFIAIATAEIANFSERRIYRLLDGRDGPLPKFLTAEPGLNSGLMVTQYLAAALVSENKVLSHPASVDSIPTSGGTEDHVSMGSISAVKARRVVENSTKIVATELICASQALKFHDPLKSGRGVAKALAGVREAVPVIGKDRQLSGDIERVSDLVREGRFIFAECLGDGQND